MFPVWAWMYVILALGISLLVPPYVATAVHPALAALVFALNLGLMIFVWRSCSSPRCPYWFGMNVIATSMMSGCANITILYAPVVLIGVYVLSIGYAVLGLLPSQEFASVRWEGLVLRFGRRILGDPDRPSYASQALGARAHSVRPTPIGPSQDKHASAAIDQAPARWCTACGAWLKDGDKYCRECGEAVVSAE